MKRLTPVMLTTVGMLAAPAFAGDPMADQYFSGKNPPLTAQEKAAIAISNQWKNANGPGTKPTMGPDGTVMFLYGISRPSIVCAPLQVCDIELQPGEQVNNLNVGDPVRWHIDGAVTGVGRDQVEHIIIKPRDVGLETSLIVTTNRRTYHFQLRSHRSQYMARVAFTYPEEAMKKWTRIQQAEQVDRDQKTMPQTGEYLGDLSFAYSIEGNGGDDGRWKPLRVYNNGVKTIIQMPATMSQTEAPTLLVIRGGGLFSKPEEVMVNYRIHDDRYIVDSVFDKAILIAGVGRQQERITITREK